TSLNFVRVARGLIRGDFTMRYLNVLFLVLGCLYGGRVFAFGVDVGPVHIHGTKVKVGDNMDLKVKADSITRDEDDKDRVRKNEAHRKGDSDDKVVIKVVWSDLDDKS